MNERRLRSWQRNRIDRRRLLQSGIGARSASYGFKKVGEIEPENQHDEGRNYFGNVQIDRVQRIGGAAEVESLQGRHNGNQKQKPKNQQPDDIRRILFDAAPFKRLPNPCPLGERIKVTDPEKAHDNSLYDVAQHPTDQDDGD